MCGRARCTLDPGLVARATGVPPDKWVDKEKYHPSYNFSPGRYAPILRNARKSADASEAKEDGEEPKAAESDVPPERIIQCMKWGLVPSFTKKDEKPDFFRMFNARGESIHERAAFRRLLPRSRCVAMAEGFYEWKKDEKSKAKQPYYIHYKDESRPLLFAALCDRWEDAEGNVLHTYTIVTTRVSKALEWLHDRMPVILSTQSEVDTWLRPELPVEKVLQLAKPYESPDLVWHPVTSEIGKPSFDSPACVKEVTPTTAATSAIASLFKKAAKPSEAKDRPNSDAGPKLETAEEEKAFAAAVIPDRDVSKALGKRKDRSEGEVNDDRPEPGLGASGEGALPSGTGVNASDAGVNTAGAGVNAPKASGWTSEAGGRASEASGRASEVGSKASDAVGSAFEAASEKAGAASDAITDAVGGVVTEAIGAFGSAAERLAESVGVTASNKGEDKAEGVDLLRDHERGPVESTGHQEEAGEPTGTGKDGRKKEDQEKEAPGQWRSRAPGPSPKSEKKRGQGKSAARPVGTHVEPSPKKQKTLTAFFTKQ
ncbi:hypothetical protein KFL_001880060 [Klebsormidium nitens]|uniref:Embryonic stem cell-specific 5-hydroxymethylcytosine-binding protein n=1 Tax=Klebsormidium nitens TaxID=105231 RepID=A0A1Y1I377_KLENI|nr:hypothetical protein KFL_001880060 [Klebsormidium nitens]|eukprot:GAQ84412.1 hypothetical protein KFL_001880060 [Klebsormidium nitens]